jgi:two-component system, sporulation sensor kinase E
MVLTNINDLIRETLIVMESQIVSNNIVIALDMTENMMEVELDPPQIKQVFINIMQNAINAIGEGGSIGIRTVSGESSVIVEFNDTGRGIPEQYLNHVCEPFFTTRGNGTGLGLSISHRIIQNHRGKLDVTSIEGEGTTVRITLPTGL